MDRRPDVAGLFGLARGREGIGSPLPLWNFRGAWNGEPALWAAIAALSSSIRPIAQMRGKGYTAHAIKLPVVEILAPTEL